MPSLFMAFGDGVTGIVRNAVIRKRSKSAIGNVFMFIVSAPIGWYVGMVAEPSIPVWGVIAAIVPHMWKDTNSGRLMITF